jgi:hypothetical protein
MRRIFLLSLVIAALLLSACGPAETPTPQVVKETVEVVVTKEVEKEVLSQRK